MVRLWASSSALDTDFTAKLLDVYPPSPDSADGFALNLADSIVRARYRNCWTRAEFLTPDQVEEFDDRDVPHRQPLSLPATASGLTSQSSNFPRFDVNPNTGEPLGRHRRFELAHQTICHDAAHPSHIILPVIPAE